ncbi:MAG: SDR family oxidoreductase [Deltaproteobacteria bacterium]|nr:SDR family oxidoreductase [Deltaproteobacteria bacterium]
MKDLFNVKGKIAVVTGGGRGIGYMIARGFVESGVKVYISSRKAANLEAAAKELSKEGGQCVAIPADLSRESGAKKLGDAIKEREEKIHILVNNAGATWGAPFEEFSDDAWERVLNINVKGPFFVTQALMPLLKKAATPEDPARIINIGSVAGFTTGGVAFSYGPSKAAVHHMTKNWACQFAKDWITVNAIAPGAFPSKMMAFITDNDEARKAIEARIPLNRIGSPDDAAGLAIFLSSRAGAYLTGTVIPLDGGSLIRSGE